MTSTAKVPLDPKKVVKHHLDRLKREEEEDQWISGEELYTEGSSDEEDKVGESKHSKKREHRGARPKALRVKSEVPSQIPRPPAIQTGDRDSDSADEAPPDISWKPKRGSIRLPHVVGETHDSQHLKTTEALAE